MCNKVAVWPVWSKASWLHDLVTRFRPSIECPFFPNESSRLSSDLSCKTLSAPSSTPPPSASSLVPQTPSAAGGSSTPSSFYMASPTAPPSPPALPPCIPAPATSLRLPPPTSPSQPVNTAL
ncbi:hypothetical protein HPP92_002017 [Vanilla planifolia]|uniref:Uncharacterized protein n=1 Tax=Vanilla planifolia TaxID=51239 RepID=A0A835S7Q6_VANPL|nr:hypothetical protein HPP92_002017 [Vanilla planifolia]